MDQIRIIQMHSLLPVSYFWQKPNGESGKGIAFLDFIDENALDNNGEVITGLVGEEMINIIKEKKYNQTRPIPSEVSEVVEERLNKEVNNVRASIKNQDWDTGGSGESVHFKKDGND